MGENITITLHSSHRPTFLHRYTRCRFTVIPIPEGAHYLQASFTRKVSLSLSICRYKIGSFFFFRGGEKSRSSLQKFAHPKPFHIFPFNIRAPSVPRHCSLSFRCGRPAFNDRPSLLSVPRSSEIIPTPPIVNRQ